MVILIVDVCYIRGQKAECNAPVSAHADRPSSPAVAFQCVEIQPGQGHVLGLHGDIQTSEDQPEPIRVLGLDPCGRASKEETLEALVAKPQDGHWGSVTRNVSSVNPANLPLQPPPAVGVD